MTVFLQEQVYHRQHAQQSQVILDVLEKRGDVLLHKMVID